MNLQEKYDELDNIINTLDVLVDETKDKYFIDLLNEIKYEAQEQLTEVERDLNEKEEKELLRQNKEIEESRL